MTVKKISQEMKNDVALLAANNASVTKISRETGLHHKTVKAILAEPATVQQVEQYSKLMGEIMIEKAREIVERITDIDIDKAGLRDKVVAVGILQDKARISFNLDKPAPLINVNIVEADVSRWFNK